MKKIKINEAVNNYFLANGLSTVEQLSEKAQDFINEYGATDSGYICDLITEFADSNTSIYYYDIKNFIINNLDAVTDAINELGWDGCGGDLYKAGQAAEFLTIERALYDDLTAIVKHLAIEYITNIASDLAVADSEQLTELLSELENNLEMVDNNDYIDIIADYCNEFIEKVKEL
jgi:hypothetical protein